VPDPATDATDASQGVNAVRALARASRILERATGELSLAHYRVLAAVASGEERASRVAARLALGRPAISAAVDSLGQRGLLERVEVDGDARAAALTLTEAGRRVLEEAETEMVRRIEDLAARTPDSDRLLESLAWLGPAIDQVHDERRATEALAGKGSTSR
jgi:DNA-binding MarR family transcriptional regulator